jgi:hypothetical protein
MVVSVRNVKGGEVAKKPTYKSDKRKKELVKLKKQEEKRQKRFKKDGTPIERDEKGEAT